MMKRNGKNRKRKRKKKGRKQGNFGYRRDPWGQSGGCQATLIDPLSNNPNLKR